MMSRRHWISAGILVLAFVLRLLWLDIKPAHFDEGVNGWFVDRMSHQGFYHYDPTNFHGPLHFYVLFVAQTLFGRSLWVLRMPIVLLSTACVGLVLGFRRYVDGRVCQVAALAMAISPGMVFYGRYAIHETWLLFFLLLIAWGLPGLWHFGERRYLWATALGVTGIILTKETYVIHLVSFLLAAVCLLGYEWLSPSEEWKFQRWKFGLRDGGIVAAVCVGLLLFFYTGGFLDWSALPGMWETFATWVHTGTDKKSGHEKEWYYWLQLLGRYEWPGAVGLVGGLWMLWPRTPRILRYLAIYGLGAAIAYSIVSYKTPWCIISLVWPFYFLFGYVVVRGAELTDRWVAGTLTALLLLESLGICWKLNYRDYTDDAEPYVYVQTTTDVNRLILPLQTLAKSDPLNYQLRGHLILTEQYPFTWLLGDFPQVDFPDADQLPEHLDADFLLVDDANVEKVEALLHLEYYKLPMRIRGNSDSSATLYLFPQTFGGFVSSDTPKFEPGEKKEIPAPAPEPENKEAK
ncbi:MAG TPA: flippase activity-associated protein Agl23 [Chthoniobacter sp.]|nr:flippase activity-associated protein Agl23 [Chthoniobacter sp.]